MESAGTGRGPGMTYAEQLKQPEWKQPRGLLMCLCWECHQERQRIEQELHLNVALAMRDKSNEELAKQPIYGFFSDGFTVTGNGGVE